jgi:hypothetical protein
MSGLGLEELEAGALAKRDARTINGQRKRFASGQVRH